MNNLTVTLLLTLTCFFLSTTTFAQDKKTTEAKQKTVSSKAFVKKMKPIISQIDSIKNGVELLGIAQKFEEMTEQYPDEWLAPYYTAYCYNLMAYSGRDSVQRDAALEHANNALDQAQNLNPASSENLLLQAYIYQMQIDINPETRSKKIAPIITSLLEEVEKNDPENPRLYFLKAQRLFFSSNPSQKNLMEACPIAQEAVFRYATHEPDSDIAPQWGENMADYIAGLCQELDFENK